MQKRKSIIAIAKAFIIEMKHGSVVTLRHVNGIGFILHALIENESPKVTGIVQYVEKKKVIQQRKWKLKKEKGESVQFITAMQ